MKPLAHPQGLVIHHPAFYQPFIDARPGQKLVDEIRREHVQGNGWSDIGYHYVVNKDANGVFKVFDGRSDRYEGAHCYGYNDWLGISVAYGMGTVPPAQQLDVLATLIAALCKEYKLPIDSAHIKGHRDMPGHRSNECPGQNLYNRLPQVIELAKQKANGKLPQVPQQKTIPANAAKEEQHFAEIKVEFPDKKDLVGLLMDGATMVHITALNGLVCGNKKLDVQYVPAANGQQHKVKVVWIDA